MRVDVLVVDSTAGPATQSRATDLHPRTLELLGPSGLTDLLLPLGRTTRRVEVHGPRGRLGHYTTDGLRTPYPYLLTVPQCTTEGMLDDLLAGLGRPVRRGTTVTGLAVGDGRVTAVTAAGDSIEARWVVGCDGPSSRVRVAAGITATGRTYPHRYLIADVRADCALDERALHMLLHPRGLVAVLPMHLDGWRRVMLQLPAGPDTAAGDGDVVAGAADRGVALTVGECRWRSVFRVHRRLAGTLRRGPVLLAGDAAHVCSPIGGQGLNLGLGDAVTLAAVLPGVLRGERPPTDLDTWARHRRARAVLAWTDLATRCATVGGQPVPHLRDAAARAVLATGPGRHALAGLVAGLPRRRATTAVPSTIH